MALTDVIFDTISSEANRGNIGVIVDILDEKWYSSQLTLEVPLTTEVQSGVTFGPQDSLVGSYIGSGGGGSSVPLIGPGGLVF